MEKRADLISATGLLAWQVIFQGILLSVFTCCHINTNYYCWKDHGASLLSKHRAHRLSIVKKSVSVCYILIYFIEILWIHLKQMCCLIYQVDLNILNVFYIYGIHIYIFLKSTWIIMIINNSMLIVYIYLNFDILSK